MTIRGVARNLFRRGQKSGFRRGTDSGVQSPRWCLGKSPKHEKYAENLIDCHKFYTVQTKKIQRGNFEGDMSPHTHDDSGLLITPVCENNG